MGVCGWGACSGLVGQIKASNHPPHTHQQTNALQLGSPHLMQRGWWLSVCGLWFVVGGGFLVVVFGFVGLAKGKRTASRHPPTTHPSRNQCPTKGRPHLTL